METALTTSHFEKNPKKKELIERKMGQFMERVEQLKEVSLPRVPGGKD